MSGLADFITARLGEDEAAANAALEQSAEEGTRWWFDDAAPETPREFHVARHDPARVLREVTAKRAMVAAHQPVRSEGRLMCSNCLGSCTFWPCTDMRTMGAVWSDHQDYQSEWKPSAP